MKRLYIYIGVIALIAVLLGSVGWYYLSQSQTTEKVTLRFVYVSEKTRNLAWEAIIQAFEKENPDITIAKEPVAQADLLQKTVVMINTGTTPDVYVMYEDYLGQLSATGAVENITDRFKALDFFDDFEARTISGATVNGSIYMVPQTVYPDGMYIRTDRIKALGLPAPSFNWTWDDFLSYAKALTRDVTGDGVIDQYGFGMRGAGLEAFKALTAFIYAGGGDVYQNGKVVINSTEAVAAAQWYIDLFRTQKVCPPSAPTDAWFGIVEGFGRGTTSIYLHNCGSIAQQNVYLGATGYTNIPLPIGPANRRVSYMGQVGLSMFKGNKHNDEAWKFIQFCASGWAMQLWNDAVIQLPPRKSIAALPVFANDTHLGVFVASFPFLQSNPYLRFPAWGGLVTTKGVANLQKALVGEMTAKEMLDQLASDLIGSM